VEKIRFTRKIYCNTEYKFYDKGYNRYIILKYVYFLHVLFGNTDSFAAPSSTDRAAHHKQSNNNKIKTETNNQTVISFHSTNQEVICSLEVIEVR
jgi:hypothetical protein